MLKQASNHGGEPVGKENNGINRLKSLNTVSTLTTDKLTNFVFNDNACQY